MRRGIIVVAVAGLLMAALGGTSVARDRPFGAAKLIAMKWGPAPEERDLGTGGGTDPGGQFSVEQIEQFRCASAGARPAWWTSLQHHHNPGLEPGQRDRCGRRPDRP